MTEHPQVIKGGNNPKHTRVDYLTPEERSRHMALIRSRNTKPEMVVRRWLHSRGYRYRLHRKDLPGSPDIAFPSRRKVILVHGCLWHGHRGCGLNRVITARPEYWQPKLQANRRRDARNLRALRKLGWDVIVIWECQTRDMMSLGQRLVDFLETR